MGLGIDNMNTSPLPSSINNCNAYLSGNKLLGVADLVCPKIEFNTEEITGAGIAGSFESVMVGHLKPMIASVKFHVPTTQMFKTADYEAGLTFRAAGQSYNRATSAPVLQGIVVEIKGTPKSLDPGTLNPGSKTDGTVELSVFYFKMSIGGEVVCEIDPMNNICNIGGVDYLGVVNSLI